MQTKKLLYAAVGAPISVAKTAQARVEEIRVKLTEGAGVLTKDLGAQLEEWAKEGEELISRIGDSKAVDGLTERMDLDQVQEQVTRLRDQLEDLLDTWRSNFRPANGHPVEIPLEDAAATATGPTTSQKPAAKKPATKKPATKKPAAQKPAAQKPAAQKSAPGEKPAAGETVTGTASAEKPDTPTS